MLFKDRQMQILATHCVFGERERESEKKREREGEEKSW